MTKYDLHEHRKSGILALLFCVLFYCHSYAQNRQVTGKVTEAGTKYPVIGAAVKVKGTNKGAATNPNGEFKIDAEEGSVLEISSVGYRTVSIVADFSRPIQVILEQDNRNLQEVVVVGYGSRKKETLSGSVAQIGSEVFKDRGSMANPLAALQGEVPGVVVTRSSGAPGREDWDLQIRGASSVNGAPPLIIVNGVPLVSPSGLNSINPNDIESMSFLKDASAAIYGSRAAGGVVLITTKRAKAGKPSIQYDASLSQKRIGLQPSLLSTQQWGPLLLEAQVNNSTVNLDKTWLWYRLAEKYLDPPASGYIDLTKEPNTIGFGDVKDFTFFFTDWQDVLFDNASTSQHNLSLSARGEKMGYRLSLGYLNDNSLLQFGENSNKRYTARLNYDYAFSDNFKVETNISLEKNDIVQPTRVGNALSNFSQPGFPTSTINGKPYGWGTQYTPNWLIELGGENKEYNNRIYTSVLSTYKFSKHLDLVGQASYNWNGTDIKEQSKTLTEWYNYAETAISSAANPSQQNSYYDRRFVKDSYYNLNAYFNYTNTFNAVHDFGLTLGTNYERDEFNAYNTRSSYQAYDDVPSLGLGIGDNTTKVNGESQNHWAIGSYFGRFNYAYKNKYLFEANSRYDGTSRFIASKRWSPFYGLSAAWRITQEPFMKNFRFISDLKLRLSNGTIGNQSGIGYYDYIQLLTVAATGGPTSANFPILGNSPAVYVGPNRELVSIDRAWEKVETTNLGLDFGVLNSRLSGSFDYFIKNNRNMLTNSSVSALLGANAPKTNIGHLRVWGWDLSLNWKDKIGKFKYSIGGTLSDNDNKLVSIGGQLLTKAGFTTGSAADPHVEGYPIGSYFGLEYAGRIKDEATRTEYNTRLQKANSNIAVPIPTTGGGARIGDNMFVDQNGDGVLTVPDDIIYLGRNDPRYTYAINLSASYGRFDFLAIFQGVGKRTIFRDGNWRVPFGNIGQGVTNQWVGKTFTPENPDAYYPLLSVGTPNNPNYNGYNYQISSWSVENGAYLRLKNISLGYTFPKALTQRAKIENLRLYVSGSDIWEWSKIKDGWDPEQTRTISGGIQRYPFYRLVNVGVNLTL
ncbi:SusC/RagA family TonB-linked outer membrane protein [Desertivirga arenae]|uniref:SusC/RagA family TonB-linked outer membrane protein n=1 Tax=Desertivirga arenae TaxID=2810309 RepID=UPI001A976233|nr:TonB-dependent receptor [Pedobacter sp. SYSU D00823]